MSRVVDRMKAFPDLDPFGLTTEQIAQFLDDDAKEVIRALTKRFGLQRFLAVVRELSVGMHKQ